MSKINNEDQLIANLVEQFSYPPYNLEQIGSNGLRLTLAVQGYDMDEISIGVTDDYLTIEGTKLAPPKVRDEARKFIHHGIAEQNFRKRFPLWGRIKIEGASFDNGFLTIDAVHLEPQIATPRKVDIKPVNKLHH